MTKSIDEGVFDQETEEKWYLLGITYAKVRLKAPKHVVFGANNKDLLEIVKRLLQSEHNIYGDNRARHNSFYLTFSSELVYDYLENRGIGPKKRRKFPELDDEFASHFIRGFYDSESGIRQDMSLNFGFPRRFLLGLQRYLHENAETTKKQVKNNHLGYADEDIERIYDFIYQDWEYVKRKGLYLPEKKSELEECIGQVNSRPLTPHEIVLRKVEQAKVLLLKHRDIDMVSRLIGYSHSSTLYNNFKKYTGKTPTQYIRENAPAKPNILVRVS